jgi:hypothetical protein
MLTFLFVANELEIEFRSLKLEIRYMRSTLDGVKIS